MKIIAIHRSVNSYKRVKHIYIDKFSIEVHTYTHIYYILITLHSFIIRIIFTLR